MLKVKIHGREGAVECPDGATATALVADIPAAARRVGTSVMFTPNRPALDHLVRLGAEFHPDCKLVWGKFYKSPSTEQVSASFEFLTAPRKYQRDDFDRFCKAEAFALEWEMGLGKTKEFLDIAAWRYTRGLIDAVLVCTLEGVHANWVVEEAPKHLSASWVGAFWVPHRVEGGMRDLANGKGLKLATINFESMIKQKGKAFCKAFLKQNRTFMIVDESHKAKTHNSKTTKTLHELSDLASFRATGTGTPIGKSPLDVWGPYTFLDERILNRGWFFFEKRYAIKKALPGVTYPRTVKGKVVDKPVKTIVGYQNEEELRALIEPHRSRRTKAKELDLPPKLYEVRHFEISDEQRKILSGLKDELRTMVNGQEYVLTSQLVSQSKVLQVLSGFLITDNGLQTLKKNPRLDALADYAEQVQEHAIVWTNFTHSTSAVAERLRKMFGDDQVVVYDGSTPKQIRPQIVSDFQNGRWKWIVGQVQALGTGRTLTKAADVSYYESLTDYILRTQSEDRAHRIGQEKPVTITDLMARGTPEDSKRRRNLRNKHEMASVITGDDLLEWLQDL